MSEFDELCDVLLLMYSPDETLELISKICTEKMSKVKRRKAVIQAIRTGIGYIQLDRESIKRELTKKRGY